MILTAHQPVYLPWLGLFHKIANADVFVSFNQVQYLPKDWNNRNRIKTPNGPIWLSVPVRRKGYRDFPIRELEINNELPWKRKHWRSLHSNYKSAPYFKQYADYFDSVYRQEWRTLVELNEYMLRWFLDILGIQVEFHVASDYSFQGKKSALVLDMCLQMGARHHIFGAQGRNYAEVQAFEANDVKVAFQNFLHPVYPQLHGEFVSHLSIVDLLFNCGPRSLEILMQDQEQLLA